MNRHTIRRAGPRSAYVNAAGFELHVTEWGDPALPALVMWHGLARTGRDFDDAADALSDSYFIDKKLYPNVDFYSGVVMSAIGFPTSMFTVLFAISRTVGWIAQWTEMMEDPEQKIGRPRQLYVGASRRDIQTAGRK